jgi:O-antigen biosynthesis protein
MLLSIVIVSYNVKPLLQQCLVSAEKAIEFLKAPAEIIVVDNNSGDGSAETIRQKFPGVKLIANQENRGFAKACNQGMGTSSGEYILLLNPDTVIPPDCFQKCLSFFTKHPDAGAIGVRMVDENGKFLKESKRGFPTPAASFFKLFGLAKLFPRSKRFAAYYLGHLGEKNNQEVAVLSGAFMMIPKKVLEKTGYFDEAFFMYGEDIDLSCRIREAGFRNYYLAETTIIHLKGKSTPRKDTRYIKEFYRAMQVFTEKYYRNKSSYLGYRVIKAGIAVRKSISLFINFFK